MAFVVIQLRGEGESILFDYLLFSEKKTICSSFQYPLRAYNSI